MTQGKKQRFGRPYIETYYRDTLVSNVERPSLEGQEKTEICVIGGGLAGLSTALGLVEKGKKVTLIESNRIGWGASGRNGGFVAKGYSASHERLVKKVGLERAQDLHRLAIKARSDIYNRIEEYNIECEPVRRGVLGVSWNQGRDVRDHIEFMDKNFDVTLEYWSKDKVREACQTTQYHDGYFADEDFQFHPLNYVHGLARIIEEKGGVIYEGTRAEKVEEKALGTGQGYIVRTPQGSIECDQVVLCCSIYINGISQKLKYASFPVYTYVMVTKPIPEELLENSLNTEYAVFDNRYAQDYYRRLPDNRILWGGRVSVKGVPENLAQIMTDDLIKIYPQLQDVVEPEYAWGGKLCYAPHKMPQIGQMKPGYWYNTCFGGHGLVPTAVGGDVVSSAIANGDERYKLFAPFSKPNFAGGPISPYVAQSVYYLWRARDVMKSLKKRSCASVVDKKEAA
ncbi:MAG: FAD-binding oxidoreductase [Alphaproteobacteria bacterium]|nr:FAD-binding oxidoreductase [Alphaproteobacteria bacterium]